MSTTISRLQAANPSPVQADRGQSAPAREALERILIEPQGAPRRLRRRLRTRLPRGGVAVAIALSLAGGGAAFAATNPFGWWSSNLDQAKFAINPSAHAQAPKAFSIGCRGAGDGRSVCQPARLDSLGRPHARGQLYTQIDTIQQPNRASLFTRANFLRAAQKLSPARAAKVRRDLSRVPDIFFTELRLASRYQTYGVGGSGRVPPAGVPEFLVCEQAGGNISCQNLNGDERAPVGAAVYAAQPAADWRPAPAQRPDYGSPPGIHFTRAEDQVLIDFLRYGTTTSSGSTKVHSVRASAG